VLALDPKTGKIKWHYQFSPNNPFDCDSVAEMVLATLNINGTPTKVAMDADRSRQNHAHTLHVYVGED
jgi:alcohol dehydrogenase (cytochrome c)